jgi:cytochrome bd-type quinol oxidase subunit 2
LFSGSISIKWRALEKVVGKREFVYYCLNNRRDLSIFIQEALQVFEIVFSPVSKWRSNFYINWNGRPQNSNTKCLPFFLQLELLTCPWNVTGRSIFPLLYLTKVKFTIVNSLSPAEARMVSVVGPWFSNTFTDRASSRTWNEGHPVDGMPALSLSY